MANGFANRFLFVCVRRSKLLPHGGSLHDGEIHRLGRRLRERSKFGKSLGRVHMTEAARAEWETIYPYLSAEQPGLLGAITARAEAQCVRLALVYALLDQQESIDVPHLRAALAVWEYCEASAARIFGNALGDPVADEILRALLQAGSAGMTPDRNSGSVWSAPLGRSNWHSARAPDHQGSGQNGAKGYRRATL